MKQKILLSILVFSIIFNGYLLYSNNHKQTIIDEVISYKLNAVLADSHGLKMAIDSHLESETENGQLQERLQRLIFTTQSAENVLRLSNNSYRLRVALKQYWFNLDTITLNEQNLLLLIEVIDTQFCDYKIEAYNSETIGRMTNSFEYINEEIIRK
ncbi:hypothetical protein [Bacillus solitudinis]|uniref:hypothetical protein n=2 Tax=Bacillus solitudinis TaxID=2014074 RepID=UPI000C23A4D2|nr:hypothetical protein [Bacillus solitudinis]